MWMLKQHREIRGRLRIGLWVSIGEGLPTSRQRREWVPRSRSHIWLPPHAAGSPGASATDGIFLAHAPQRLGQTAVRRDWARGRREAQRGKRKREEKEREGNSRPQIVLGGRWERVRVNALDQELANHSP